MTAFRHSHSVKFYADDASLCGTVSAFLTENLAGGLPAILIATAAHEAGILQVLGGRSVNWEKAVRDGVLVLRNAESTLDAFMVDGRPDKQLFERQVGALIGSHSARHNGAPVRAYGEMVDVLWKRGDRQAAIELEALWNELAARHRFALLCGYAMGNFYKQHDHLGLEDVCAQHTEVVSDLHDYVPRAMRRPPQPS